MSAWRLVRREGRASYERSVGAWSLVVRQYEPGDWGTGWWWGIKRGDDTVRSGGADSSTAACEQADLALPEVSS